MARPKKHDRCPLCTESPIDKTQTDILWIRCDICRQWFHNLCVDVSEELQSKITSYHCSECAIDNGPSHLKRQLKRARVKIDYVALDQGDTFAVDKSLHPHVPSFMDFEPEVDTSVKTGPVDILGSDELTREYVLLTGLIRPVLVPNVDLDSVGMHLPCERNDITVAYIAEKTGEDENVEVMDVLSQQSESPGWSLGQWKKYFYTNEKDRIRNVISLEVSEVEELGKTFRRPQMVRDLDLVDKVWKDEDPRPKVTVYCLMSVAGSYTDFHIDFSGTPVYYTVCLGTKTFLMFPPTEDNLSLYTSWCGEPQQNFTWFGNYSKRIGGKKVVPSEGFKVHLKAGDLFIIPSGWIHSVHTAEDSVIIGGNYLTLRDIPRHLQIYNIERATNVPTRYRFPMFNKVMWLTSWYYYNHQEEFKQDLGMGQTKTETGYSIGATVLASLVAHLKEHYELSKAKPVAKKSIPMYLIGRNITEYIVKLEQWLETL